MPKKIAEMAPVAVARLKSPGLTMVGGVAGLGLQVGELAADADRRQIAARSWVLRVTIGGKRREMGLGGFPEVSLAEAKDRARRARADIALGLDPIGQRKGVLRAAAAETKRSITFGKYAETYVESHAAGWANPKHRDQWSATLNTYAVPVIGGKPLHAIDVDDVLAILKPIWTTKTETASRLRGRIETILDAAKAEKLREGDNPAAWKGNLQALLPAPRKVAKTEHHAALPLSDVAPFMARLTAVEGTGARALEFTILCASRSGEVRGATWAEIDMHNRMWIVPASRMKAGREHRVPLSDAGMALLQSLPRRVDSDLLFPGAKGKPLSDMTLTAVLRRMKVDATVHGFRSCFADWGAERTNYPSSMIEMALAHKIGSEVEAAYRRGDMLEKRRALMADWANFCGR
jgi:integrase